MRQISTSTLSNQNISAALLAATHTADADRAILFRLFADQVAGNGVYQAYVTIQRLGAGSAYTVQPIAQAVVASGVTAIAFTTGIISVKNTDVVKVYIIGLAADTTTPDIVTEVWEDLSAQEVTREAHGVSGTVYHIKYAAGETMGNDALSWATADLTAGVGVKTDVEAAAAGDEVHIGAGTFAMGNVTAAMPAGICGRGVGLDVTTITSSHNSGGGVSACIALANNVELSDATIQATSATGRAIGGGGGDAQFSNAVLRRVRAIADQDALYVGRANACTLVAYDSHFEGKYDSVFAGNAAHVVSLHHCTINTQGPTAVGAYPSDGVNCSGATIWLFDCDVNSQDGTAGQNTIGLLAGTTGNIIMVGGRIRTYNAAGTDLAVKNTGSGKIILIGVDYDRAKTSNTGAGSIVDIARVVTDTAGNAYADVRKNVGRSFSDPGSDAALYFGTWGSLPNATTNKIHAVDGSAAALPTAANLALITAKLPSKTYLTGTANSDGDIQLNEATGALTAAALVNAPTSTAQYNVSTTTVGVAPEVNITAYQHAAFGPFTITCQTAQTGDSHSLLVYNPLAPTTVVWSLTTAGNEISVGGAGDKVLTIVDTDANTGTAGLWNYVLRNTTDDAVVATGTIEIVQVPNVPV